MLVTLDAELQAQRRKNSEDLGRFYGGGQKVQIDETGEITAPGASYAIPTTIRRRR
ncbi:hypothetical protein ES703_20166 [subsurface metagenome]